MGAGRAAATGDRRRLDDLRGGRQGQGGRRYGYTKVLGYHPILATRADTGEVLHARMRKGSANTARGPGASSTRSSPGCGGRAPAGEIVARVDSGYWSNDTIAALGRLDVRYTMAVRTRTKGVAGAIAAIDENAWVAIAYTAGGEAQVAECVYNKRRLVVRRTRLTGAGGAGCSALGGDEVGSLLGLAGLGVGCSVPRAARTRAPITRTCSPYGVT